jgi:hypothetical protein
MGLHIRPNPYRSWTYLLKENEIETKMITFTIMLQPLARRIMPNVFVGKLPNHCSTGLWHCLVFRATEESNTINIHVMLMCKYRKIEI